ncbi:hypothetical protein [Rhodococcus sp. A14]|uniref:hypothetical protein n=1 Tax=Rhodococcus sp. A14 TaxID=1194106 RepID=UPI001F0D7DAE
MTMTENLTRGDRVDRLARAVTEVGAPWVLNIVSSLFLGVYLESTAWGIFVAMISGGLPMAFILFEIWRSRIGDHHVTEHRERHLLIVVILAIVLAGLFIQICANAPAELIAFTAAGFATLLAIGIITSVVRWKVSVHTAVSAGITVILTLAVSPIWILALACTPAIGWSRVRLGDHTTGQVIVGAFVGAFIAGGTYTLFT